MHARINSTLKVTRAWIGTGSTHNEQFYPNRPELKELTATPTRPLHDDAHVFVVFCDAQDVHDGRFAAGFERDVTNPTLRRRCWVV